MGGCSWKRTFARGGFGLFVELVRLVEIALHVELAVVLLSKRYSLAEQ